MRAAIGNFLVEFTQFESLYMDLAIRALTFDATLVEHLHELMDLEKRMKLLQRLAEARGVSKLLMTDLKTALSRARKLSDHRNVIAHNAAVITVHGPRMDAIEDMTAGVRLPKSKRKTPVSTKPLTPEELKALANSWMCTLPQIERYTREAARTMFGIADRLSKHMRNIYAANV